MNEAEIREIVLAAAGEINGKKKLPCVRAFELADEHSIPLKEIARCCDRNDIKISSCQLGCF